MKITNGVYGSVEELFQFYDYKIDPLTVSSARCIASEDLLESGVSNFGVYELHIGDKIRYFAVAEVDYVQSVEDEITHMKSWTQSEDVKLLEHQGDNGFDNIFLFELTSPFGITHSSQKSDSTD